jgi:hypothetical protein
MVGKTAQEVRTPQGFAVIGIKKCSKNGNESTVKMAAIIQ